MAAIPTTFDVLATERRSRQRYALALNVRYHVISKRPGLVGIGRTLNMSSGGLLIASDKHIVRDCDLLEVSLEWPFRLDGTTLLQLIAQCRVVRCQSTAFAVKIGRYQFYTRKRRHPFPEFTVEPSERKEVTDGVGKV